MDIYQRKDSPLWYADLTHPVTGRGLRESLKTTNKAEAWRRAVVWLVVEGMVIPPRQNKETGSTETVRADVHSG